MGSQSSFTMAFRAIVMLACLILVPLVALFGTSLPEVIKRIVQRQLDGNTVAAAASFFEGFPFGSTTEPSAQAARATLPANAAPAPLAAPPGGSLPMMAASNGVWPTNEAAQPGTVNAAASMQIGAPGQVVPAEYLAQVSPSNAASAPGPWTSSQPLAAAAVSNTIPAVPAAGMPASLAAAPLDRFTWTKDRLRDLGATYYLLETWGSQGQFFRFYCKIAVGGSPNYTRYFEATDPDPLRAMSAVLEQVETWRAGRP